MIKNILIVEDEKPNADRLKRLIGIVRPDIAILDVLGSVSESMAWLLKNDCPDLIMMDIRLSDGLSFEILEQTNLKCPIIFTTAYDEYAVRAFKFNSVDYILKPIDQDELALAIEKVEERNLPDPMIAVQNLLNHLDRKAYRSRFLLPYRDGFKTLLVNEVAYFYVELKITRAFLNNSTEENLGQTLEELEQQLDPKQFFRANRQFIINIDAVQNIHNYFNGKLKIKLKHNPEAEVIVSREKAQQFRNWMDY
ncbi:LytR/AlgR family response regulator transcription factor [Pedobacter soli]|uniref:Two component transcriptional regulator, LytTR family n=1 Tax=Pedobacter soli TaxID=390242 RepID=A0A1G6SA07_9SPHI|nr:LytTR family DNA-binding domain-containing protein [Pedobacter soli]SDD13504.1 two component transcriptional regulator, LytTR family [Pedobacter soli]